MRVCDGESRMGRGGGRGGEEGEEKTLGAQARQAMPTSALF